MVLLVAVAAAVRIPGVTANLWFDELWATHVILGSGADLARQSIYDIGQPLYHVLMFAWIRLFGDGEVAVRLPSLLAGLATIALMPRLGAELESRVAGWIGAVWLALSPVHIWYSVEARPYSILMLLAVVLVISLCSDGQRQRIGRPAVFVLLSVAMAMTHPFAVVLSATLALLALSDGRRRPKALAGFAAAMLAVLLLLAVRYSAGALRTGDWYLRTFTPMTAIELFTSWFLLGGTQPRFAPAAVTVLYLLLVAVLLVHWLLADRSRGAAVRRARILALTGSLPVVLLLADWMGRQHYFVERSALQILPFFALAIGAAIVAIAHPVVRWTAAAAIGVCSVSTLMGSWAQREEWTVTKPKPDWRGVVRVLNGRSASSATVLVLGATPISELLFYLPGAVECPWSESGPAARPVQRDRATGSWPGRLFPARSYPTCGAGGSARARLYVVPDGRAETVRRILEYEGADSAFVIVSRFWLGESEALLADLRRTSSLGVTLVAQPPGEAVWVVGRAGRSTLPASPARGESPSRR